MVGIVAIVDGRCDSGAVGLIHTRYMDDILSHVHLARVFDLLTILAALVLLVSYIKSCPACKQK